MEIDGPRACRSDELEELLELVNFVFRTSHGRAPTIATDYPHIYRESNLENLSVIGIDGALRACLGVWPMEIAAGDISLQTVGGQRGDNSSGLAGTRLCSGAHGGCGEAGTGLRLRCRPPVGGSAGVVPPPGV